MEFYDVVGQVLELLQRQKRVSYRALKRQFSIDDDYIEDLKEEFLYAHESSIQVDNRGFTWTGETDARSNTPRQSNTPASQPAVEQVQPLPTTQSVEPRTPDAERRQLTVMFCDLVGSTCDGQVQTDSFLSHQIKFFIFVGTQIPQIRMLAVRVVEHLDILNDVITGFLSRFVIAMRRPLPLEATEKSFPHRIIKALTFTTHAAYHPMLAQPISVRMTGILRATNGPATRVQPSRRTQRRQYL